MFRKHPQKLYADLILANLGKEEKRDNVSVIQPKLLVGITHRLGGAKSWEGLEEIATFTSKENPIPEFKRISESYALSYRAMDNLILNLFLKAGWRNRKKSGLIVEQTPRKIDRETILGILDAKGIYLDTIYVHFGKDSYQVVSYCSFSINDKEAGFSSGAAYSVKVLNWQNTQKALDNIVNMLIEENNA
jgi:hypothetical protein